MNPALHSILSTLIIILISAAAGVVFSAPRVVVWLTRTARAAWLAVASPIARFEAQLRAERIEMDRRRRVIADAAARDPEPVSQPAIAIAEPPIAPDPRIAFLAAAIGRSLAIADSDGPITVGSPPPRRESLSGDHTRILQGAPINMDTVTVPGVVAPEYSESLSLPKLPPAAIEPLKTLLLAALSAAGSKAPELLALLKNENVKLEDLIESAAAAKSPVLGMITKALSSEIINALGGEEAAVITIVEAYLAAKITAL